MCWQWGGCKDNCREDAFGLKAKVVEQTLGQLKLEMMKVKPDGKFQNMIYNCCVEDVCAWDEDKLKPIVKKSINTLTDGEKRFALKQVWGNQKGGLEGTLKGNMLSDEDLTAIHEFLQWQYQMPDVALASASVVKVIVVEGASTVEGATCIMEVKELMKTKRVVVLPIHADLHWTAVVLEMEDIGSMIVKSVQYFDWIEPVVVRNRNYARKLLRLLTIVEDSVQFLALPVKSNKFRQREGSNDCGFVVWYALEMKMKELRMEGACALYPTPEVWRERLNVFEKNLVKEQQAWAMEDLKKKPKTWKPKCEVVRPGSKTAMDKNEEKAMRDLKYFQGKLKHLRSEYFGCSRCRWSTTGNGCSSCNPAVDEKLKDVKEMEATHMKNKVEAWYAMLKEKGILVDHVPADEILQPGKLNGGGTSGATVDFVFSCIHNVC